MTLNTKIGNETGWFGFGYNSNNAFFTNQYFETAGYPASNGYSGQQMYYSFGRITGEQGDDLLSTEGKITNVPGQSGSPLWNTGNNVIYGVNSAWNGNTAAGTQDFFARITQPVFNELQSWLGSDRVVVVQRDATSSPKVTNEPSTALTFGALKSGALETSAPASVSTPTDAKLAALPGEMGQGHIAGVGKAGAALIDAIVAQAAADDFGSIGLSDCCWDADLLTTGNAIQP